MSEPTIERRLQRKFILMSADPEMRRQVADLAGEDWETVTITDLEEIGDWHEILLHRFLLLDLDEVEAFDPLDVINLLRREYMLNIAVFCFGGDGDIRDEMRMARADRFFDRDELLAMLPEFFKQYGWGG
ncbi:MAG: hypothetical protein P8009_07045 [Gammaproteobacteria bacterium]